MDRPADPIADVYKRLRVLLRPTIGDTPDSFCIGTSRVHLAKKTAAIATDTQAALHAAIAAYEAEVKAACEPVDDGLAAACARLCAILSVKPGEDRSLLLCGCTMPITSDAALVIADLHAAIDKGLRLHETETRERMWDHFRAEVNKLAAACGFSSVTVGATHLLDPNVESALQMRWSSFGVGAEVSAACEFLFASVRQLTSKGASASDGVQTDAVLKN